VTIDAEFLEWGALGIEMHIADLPREPDVGMRAATELAAMLQRQFARRARVVVYDRDSAELLGRNAWVSASASRPASCSRLRLREGSRALPQPMSGWPASPLFSSRER
jgi:hypothetical protein